MSCRSFVRCRVSSRRRATTSGEPPGIFAAAGASRIAARRPEVRRAGDSGCATFTDVDDTCIWLGWIWPTRRPKRSTLMGGYNLAPENRTSCRARAFRLGREQFEQKPREARGSFAAGRSPSAPATSAAELKADDRRRSKSVAGRIAPTADEPGSRRGRETKSGSHPASRGSLSGVGARAARRAAARFLERQSVHRLAAPAGEPVAVADARFPTAGRSPACGRPGPSNASRRSAYYYPTDDADPSRGRWSRAAGASKLTTTTPDALGRPSESTRCIPALPAAHQHLRRGRPKAPEVDPLRAGVVRRGRLGALLRADDARSGSAGNHGSRTIAEALIRLSGSSSASNCMRKTCRASRRPDVSAIRN